MTEKIVSLKGQPWPVERHAHYGEVIQQFLTELFQMCRDVTAHYGKKELKAVLLAQEKVGRLRSLLDERVCAETAASFPATRVYYGQVEAPASAPPLRGVCLADVPPYQPQLRHGLAEYDLTADVIRLAVYPAETYDIDLSRLSTAEEFADWILHLRDKTWGPKVLADFVLCVDDAIRIKHGQSARSFFAKADGDAESGNRSEASL